MTNIGEENGVCTMTIAEKENQSHHCKPTKIKVTGELGQVAILGEVATENVRAALDILESRREGFVHYGTGLALVNLSTLDYYEDARPGIYNVHLSKIKDLYIAALSIADLDYKEFIATLEAKRYWNFYDDAGKDPAKLLMDIRTLMQNPVNSVKDVLFSGTQAELVAFIVDIARTESSIRFYKNLLHCASKRAHGELTKPYIRKVDGIDVRDLKYPVDILSKNTNPNNPSYMPSFEYYIYYYIDGVNKLAETVDITMIGVSIDG